MDDNENMLDMTQKLSEDNENFDPTIPLDDDFNFKN